MLSRTTWLVVTIVGLIAFIVGGGVALLEDVGPTPSRAEVTRETSSPSTASRVSPTVSLELAEPPDDHHDGEAKAKGHSKTKDHGKPGHGKAKGHDKPGHGNHGHDEPGVEQGEND